MRPVFARGDCVCRPTTPPKLGMDRAYRDAPPIIPLRRSVALDHDDDSLTWTADWRPDTVVDVRVAELWNAVQHATGDAVRQLWLTWRADMCLAYAQPLFEKSCCNMDETLPMWVYEQVQDVAHVSVCAFNNACAHNRVVTCRWVLSQRHMRSMAIRMGVVSAVRTAAFDVILWLHRERQSCLRPMRTRLYSIINIACTNGHLDIAKWLIQEGLGCVDHVDFAAVCRRGYLDVAQWLVDQGTPRHFEVQYHAAFTTACYHGHADVAAWLLSVRHDVTWLPCALQEACRGGHVHVARWLHSLLPDDDRRAIVHAFVAHTTETGLKNVEIANWLLSQTSARLTTYALLHTLDTACVHDDVPLFEVAFSMLPNASNCSPEFVHKLLVSACVNNAVHVLQWLLQRQAPNAADIRLQRVYSSCIMHGRVQPVDLLCTAFGENSFCLDASTVQAVSTSAYVLGHAHLLDWCFKKWGVAAFLRHPNTTLWVLTQARWKLLMCWLRLAAVFRRFVPVWRHAFWGADGRGAKLCIDRLYAACQT